ALPPFDGALSLAAPARNQGPPKIGRRGRGAERQGLLERLLSLRSVVFDHADRDRAVSQRRGVVRAQCDGGMAVANGGQTILLAPPRAHIENLIAQGGQAVRERV